MRDSGMHGPLAISSVFLSFRRKFIERSILRSQQNPHTRSNSKAHLIAMEVRRAADALLRTQASPLAHFLAPSISSRWQSGRHTILGDVNRRASQRTFVSSAGRSARSALQTPIATSADKPAENATKSVTEEVGDKLDWLNAGFGSKNTGTSRFSSPKTQAGNRVTTSYANRSELPSLNKGGSSDQDLLRAFNMHSQRPPSSRFDINKMQSPTPTSMASLNMMKDLQLNMPTVQKIPIRLTPSTGRTVSIGAGIDVGRGFRLLEQSCARNRVRSDFTQQRFHERGGLKRKRLRRERWRKRFMVGFKAAVGRVKELKKQGW